MVTLDGTPARLAATLAVTALAILVRALLAPLLGAELPFVTLYAAVVLAAWHAGTGYALLSTAVGLLAAERLFVSRELSGAAGLAGALAFLASSGLVVLFGRALRTAERRALASAENARLQQELLQREIGVRRRTEAALALQQQWLRVTLASIADGVVATDVLGRITLLNGVAQRLTGWSEEEARGQPLATVLRVVDEATREPVVDLVAEVLRSGGAVGLQSRALLMRRDGTAEPIDDSAAPIRDEAGAVLGVVVAFRDVGEKRRVDDLRRQALEDLARQHERLQLLNEAAAQLLASDDPDAIARDLFLRLERHLGLHAYLNYVMSDAGDALELRAWGGIPEGHSVPRLRPGEGLSGLVAQTLRPHHAGHLQASNDPALAGLRALGFRAAVSHPLLAEGRLIGTLAFASRSRDRFLPEELELIGTAAGYVALAYQRARLVRELREADRRKDVFLATLSHELRNSLAPISNAIELLRRRGVARAVADAARGVLERQVGQIVRLVDDLLDHARITSGVAELRLEDMELARAVDGAVETVRPLLEKEGHRLTVALPEAPVRLRADPGRLVQVLVNLLSNACRYTPKGGEIALEAAREDGSAVVRVADNGEGIASEDLPRIFETFTRASAGRHGGLGIGLSLVKGLVELHGGQVSAHSAGRGAGSVFTVSLPLLAAEATAAAERADAAPEPPQPPARVTTKRRVLVVDDSPDSVESLTLLVQALGHEVRAARDGATALEAARAFAPEVVLLDIGMPGMDGYTAARSLREQPGGGSLRIVALTGWGQDADRQRTLAAGFDAHLTKPVDPATLDQVIDPAP
jgi:PAS domain S-box-containing protein